MMRGLRALLPKGRLRRAVTVLVTGTALGQLIVLAASPLVTRLYTPEDFGVLGVFSALLGILGIAVSLRYELAIPLAEDDCQRGQSAGAEPRRRLAPQLADRGGALALGRGDHRLVQCRSPASTALAVAGRAPGHRVARSVLTYWAVRRQAFGRITRNQISRSLGQVATQIGCRLSGPGPFGLLVGKIVGQSAGITTLALAFHRIEGRIWRAIRLRGMARAAVRFGNLPTLATGAALLASGGRLAPALLVAALYGAEVAGWFALAQRILATPSRPQQCCGSGLSQ